jgi:predicted RNA-binding protein with PIN domain
MGRRWRGRWRWLGFGRRRTGGELTDPAGAIRPAVESALAVARAGLTADPVVPPPPALRPYLAFARQSPLSLEAVARVVERDAEFRRRVAAAVTEAEVGRAGWLWLTRPAGWDSTLAEIEAESAARTSALEELRVERSAARRLAAVEAAAARSEAEATALRSDLQACEAALDAERERRALAESRVAELEARLADLSGARSEAVRNLKDVEARLVERATELNAVKARLREAESALARSRGAAAPADPAPPAAGVPADRGTADPAGAGPPSVETGPAAPPRAPMSVPTPAPASSSAPAAAASTPAPASASTSSLAPPEDEPDPAAVAAEIARAAAGAASLAEGLAALARLLDRDGDRPSGTPGLTGSSGSTPAVAGETAVARLRRSPLALPGGVFDDSIEAAEHLVRVPGAVMLVDGYNVSMTVWPEAGAAEQRRRLVAALGELAARTATPVEVVFDGAEVDGPAVRGFGRQLVRVRFSSPGVEADDVVLDLARRLPAATPVIVASSDKRVRDGALRMGANLLHAHQLIALLRR